MVYNNIRTGDLTAFGEQAVAEYSAVASWKFSYNINPDLFVTNTANGGIVDLDGVHARLQTGTASNGEANIRTRKFINYQPGKGVSIRYTATYTTGVANSEQFVGYGDEDDGFFVGINGTEFGAMVRSGGGDTFIPASTFNENGLFDGFDYTLLNVYQIKFQWLGAGEIRFFIEFPELGGFVMSHRIKQANTSAFTSLLNPSLPLYAYVKNTGNTTNLTLRTPSATGGIEGKRDNPSMEVIRGVTTAYPDVPAVDTPVLSLINPTTYLTRTNRLTLCPTTLVLLSDGTGGSEVIVRIYVNPTLTGAVPTDVDLQATSGQIDTTATAFTGGNLITGTLLAGASGEDRETIDLEKLGIILNPGDTMLITGEEASGTVDLTCFLTFKTEL